MKIQTKTPRSVLTTLLTVMFTGLLGALSVNTAHGQLYASIADVTKKVVEYNLNGTPISTNLLSPVTNPYGIGLNSSYLFVADFGSGKIGQYDIVSQSYNSTFIDQGASPYAIAVSGNSLYVSFNNNAIFKYNATTGVRDTGFSATVANAFFMAVDGSGNLYVSAKSGNVVGKYDASTGATISASFLSVTAPTGIALDASGNIYVASYSGNTVTKFTSLGSSLGTFATGHMSSPNGLAFDNTGNLYVGNYVSTYAGTVAQFSPSGTFLSTITTGGNVFGVAVAVPEPSSVVLLSLSALVLGGVMRKKMNLRIS